MTGDSKSEGHLAVACQGFGAIFSAMKGARRIFRISCRTLKDFRRIFGGFGAGGGVCGSCGGAGAGAGDSDSNNNRNRVTNRYCSGAATTTTTTTAMTATATTAATAVSEMTTEVERQMSVCLLC